MSQAGLLDVINSNPQIPTQFDTDSGNAIPIANTLNLLATYVPAAGIPARTIGSGNTVTVEVQLSNESVISDVTVAGLASFDSNAFTVDANGYVTLNGGGGATTNIDVDAFTAPGTDPVVPSGGNIAITGGQVASGTIGANVIRTNSLAANTVTVEIQRSTAVGISASANNGVSHFNSIEFTVDGNGFVSLAAGGLAIDSVAVQATTAPGVSPVTHTLAGLITIDGAAVAAQAIPIQSRSIALNSLQIEVQRASSSVATNATQQGLASFDSAMFTVDASGWVTIAGGAVTENFTVDAFTGPGTNPVVPTVGGNVTVHGTAVAAHVIPVQSNSIAANSYQIEVQRASSSAATNATQQGLSSFNSAQFTVDASGWVSQANGLPSSSFGVQAFTGPGTSPVLPTAGGLVTINGTAVAAHTIPIQTDSLAANTLNVEVQRASASAVTNATQQGLASFDSAAFTVDASGWVQLAGGGLAIDSIGTQTGTNPIVPTAGGLVTINGAVVAAGTNPIRSDGTGANTMAIEVQTSQAIAAADATKIGLSNFDSFSFAVDANGFVTFPLDYTLEFLLGGM